MTTSTNSNHLHSPPISILNFFPQELLLCGTSSCLSTSLHATILTPLNQGLIATCLSCSHNIRFILSPLTLILYISFINPLLSVALVLGEFNMMITKPFQWCWDTLPRRILSKKSLPWQFDNGENRSSRLRTHINPYYRYTIKLYSASRWVATGNIKDLPTFATFQNIVLRQRYALCHHSYLRSHFSRRHATLDRDRNDNLSAW